MPQVIDHIDAIARREKRDVLYVVFPECHRGLDDEKHEDYKTYQPRIEFIKWLDEQGIKWVECAGSPRIEVEDQVWYQLGGYWGHIYVDVPYDTENPAYKVLCARLEKEDGTPRDNRVQFCYYPLAEAEKYPEHDDPAFWEKIF